MPVEKTKLEFTEKDLADLIASKYNLKNVSIRISIDDERGVKTFSIVAEGERKRKTFLH